MYVYLSKILPLFVMPLGVVLVLSLLALVLLRKGRKNIASGFLMVAVIVLWVTSTPIIGAALYRSVEARYPPRALSDIPQAGCIVVLGGALQAPAPPRIDIEMNDSVDRIYKAAELFHAGKAPYLVVTGGNQPWSTYARAEADLIRDLLVQWGVPRDSILLEGSSRNTRENALYTKTLMDSINCESALLVTSAAHMPRALAAFRSVGVSATPVSTDVRVAATNSLQLKDFLPDARALMMSQDAIRELIGQWVYELNGWN